MRILWLLALAAALHGTQSRPIIACFGDSLTAGLGLDPGESYPEVLQQDLNRRGLRYRVVNLGVSGETSQDGVERLPRVLALRPAIVVLEFGANDGLRGQPLSHTEADLAKMIQTLQKAGIRVVLAGMTLPPNYGGEYIHRFDAMYNSLAARFHVIYIPFLLKGVAGNPRLMLRDGAHPNAAGTRIVAQTVLKALPLRHQRR
jgi:acyl-CoA thioesterase-1